MDVVKIIGIKRTPSSKDSSREYINYYYTYSFSDYDLEHATEISGTACGVEFSTVDIGCKVGDEVVFTYSKGFQDKAMLVGCVDASYYDVLCNSNGKSVD